MISSAERGKRQEGMEGREYVTNRYRYFFLRDKVSDGEKDLVSDRVNQNSKNKNSKNHIIRCKRILRGNRKIRMNQHKE